MSGHLSKIVVQMIFLYYPSERRVIHVYEFKVILIYLNINSVNSAMKSNSDDIFSITVPTFVRIKSWYLLNISKTLAFPSQNLSSFSIFQYDET